MIVLPSVVGQFILTLNARERTWLDPWFGCLSSLINLPLLLILADIKWIESSLKLYHSYQVSRMYLIIDWRNSRCLLKEQRKCEIAQTVVYEPNGDIGMSLLSTFVSTSLPTVALFWSNRYWKSYSSCGLTNIPWQWLWWTEPTLVGLMWIFWKSFAIGMGAVLSHPRTAR